MPRDTSAPALRLVAFARLDEDFEAALGDALSRHYPAPIRLQPAVPTPVAAFDPDRDQARADLLLDALARSCSNGERALGIIDHDLFAPGLRYVLGEAMVGGCAAIIGLARLRPEFHGQPADRFLRRALVEALHELGHMDGLGHCADPACVMHFSDDIEDTDRKGPGFCPRCRA